MPVGGSAPAARAERRPLRRGRPGGAKPLETGGGAARRRSVQHGAQHGASEDAPAREHKVLAAKLGGGDGAAHLQRRPDGALVVGRGRAVRPATRKLVAGGRRTGRGRRAIPAKVLRPVQPETSAPSGHDVVVRDDAPARDRLGPLSLHDEVGAHAEEQLREAHATRRLGHAQHLPVGLGRRDPHHVHHSEALPILVLGPDDTVVGVDDGPIKLLHHEVIVAHAAARARLVGDPRSHRLLVRGRRQPHCDQLAAFGGQRHGQREPAVAAAAADEDDNHADGRRRADAGEQEFAHER